MTDKQPEALYLADGLEKIYGLKAAAIEMRRLHTLNAELVEALKNIATHSVCCDARHVADAAIAKATGESND